MQEEIELEESLLKLEKDPMNPSLIMKIGSALYQLEEYETAKIFFERVNVLESSNTLSEQLGDCYFQLGKYHLALEQYNKNAQTGR